MSGDDDGDIPDFEPRLGKMRSAGSKRGGKYLGRILAAAFVAGSRSGRQSSRFDGSRIGRGASMGRLLSSRDHSAISARRVIIKTRLVRLAGKGVRAAHAHLRYIQRDGVTREGDAGMLYSNGDDVADGKAFLERSTGDRHQFRFIVSAEDGDQYPDLKPLVRRLMAQMETDLGTKLDWVAVDHFNTGHPHSHIMLRGRDDRGENLIIAREYLSHGMRERASELVTLDLGPRTNREIEQRLRLDVDAERVTGIDRRLLRDAGPDLSVEASDRDPFQQSLRMGRLQKLKALGLASETAPGQWQLADGFDEVLKRMGERGDIMDSINHELGARSLERAHTDRVVHDADTPLDAPLVGRIIMRGLSDELADRHYLLVDGTDGRTHYVEIGKGEAVEPLPDQAIVRIDAAAAGVRQVDRNIVAVAAANDGRYDIASHLRHDPNASEAFAETHVRRLEAMRRVAGSVERLPSGSWVIEPDHLERAAAYEARQLRDRPVKVEILSAIALEKLPRAAAVTWLDREALAGHPTPLRQSGFGGEVRAAQAVRRQWLIEQELADPKINGIVYRGKALAILQRRELLKVAGQLSNELGSRFVEARKGERIEGIVRRKIDLISGRFAVIEKSKEFTLVPWKPVLERQIGKQVGGIMREGGVSWTFGRGRGMGIS